MKTKKTTTRKTTKTKPGRKTTTKTTKTRTTRTLSMMRKPKATSTKKRSVGRPRKDSITIERKSMSH